MFKSRRSGIRLLSFAIAIILVLSAFTYINYQSTVYYKRQAENNYNKAFTELVSNMNDICHSLQKGMYSTSPALMSTVCADVYGKVASAQLSLGMLPFTNIQLDKTTSFVNRVGDYMYVLSRKSVSGEALSEEEMDNIKSLCYAADVLSSDLNQLQSQLNSGTIEFGEASLLVDKMDSREENTQSQASEPTSPTDLGGGMQSMEEEFPEVPTLIYDGPFSEHIEKQVPELLKDHVELSQEEATARAQNFFGIVELLPCGTGEGRVKTYCFSGEKNGDSFYMDVTRQGGLVVSALYSRVVTDSKLTVEQCVQKAKDFLQSRGIESMQESYWYINNGKVTINFAYVQDEVICYSDLIKVTIARDNGEVLGYEALGYIMSHTERQLGEPAFTMEESKAKVSSSLEILEHELALIPTAGKNEVLCHEYKCKNEDNQHYIVYINTATGNEEKILVLLEDENGTLTI